MASIWRSQPGESMVIIGGSGTGKSVMIKCILGLLTPDSGSIKVDGDEVIGLSRRGRWPITRRASACCSRAARCSIRCPCGATSALR